MAIEHSRRRRVLVLGGVALALVLVAVAGLTLVSRDDDAQEPKKDATTTTAGEQVTRSMSPTEVLGVDAQFTRFAEIVAAAGLDADIDGAEAITVFAPSTEAIDSLGTEQVDELKSDAQKAAAFVKRHLVAERLSFNDLVEANGSSLNAMDGGTLAVKFENGQLSVDDVAITKSDIEVDNGWIHVLNSPS